MVTEVETQRVAQIEDRDVAKSQSTGPPEVSYRFIELPQTTLHYIECGEGPPLIMVPATISRIENWLPLAQFMGQKFTTYFFELPGHGKSTPFSEPFSSERVAETVEDFINALGYETVSIMGFSFGGILAMKSLYCLGERIERMILLAPALSNRALTFSRIHRWGLIGLVRLTQVRAVRMGFLRLIHSQRCSRPIAAAIRKVGNVEQTIPMDQVFQKITAITCEVLTHQMQEVLSLELPRQKIRFAQPCFFAMSVNDTMLDFATTLEVIEGQFKHVVVEGFDTPYHQPPDRPTFEELATAYGHFLSKIT